MQKQIPNNWQKVKLGNSALLNPAIHMGVGKHPYIPMEDLDWNKKYVSGKILKDFKGGARFEEGDVLFARITPCLENGKMGRVKNLIGNKGFGSTEYFVIRGKSGVTDTDYLYYLSRTYRLRQTAINSMVGASGRQRANIDSLQNFEFELPGLPEQEKISSILTAFDDKIELNNKISKTLEEMAQAIFKEWFVKFKFLGHEKAEFVDSELGKIPKGWEIKKIKKVARINKGLSYSSKEINETSEGLPMINLANFQRGGGFNPAGTKFYTGEYKETNLVKPGDIVIAMTDLTSNREVIGHPAHVPSYSHWGKILISLDVCSVDADELYIEFIYYLMLRKEFSYLMASSAGGTNVAHLSKSTIDEHTFVLPEKSVIKKFQDFVKPIFNKINSVEIENQKLAALRDLLLPKLMRGEIRV
jgi:type I restriction enzyme S subunit